jgi:hypothetical protein
MTCVITVVWKKKKKQADSRKKRQNGITQRSLEHIFPYNQEL